ncbi:MAG: FeoA family protein [Dermatophilaceae bacterium]
MGPHFPGNLARWPLGHAAQLVDAEGPESFRRRLGHLGLRSGALLVPLQRTPGRGLVVGVGDSRVALDRASVAAIRVQDVVS